MYRNVLNILPGVYPLTSSVNITFILFYIEMMHQKPSGRGYTHVPECCPDTMSPAANCSVLCTSCKVCTGCLKVGQKLTTGCHAINLVYRPQMLHVLPSDRARKATVQRPHLLSDWPLMCSRLTSTAVNNNSRGTRAITARFNSKPSSVT